MSVRVSVIVPTFNRSDDIGYLLGDISRQTEKNIEILIIDDGSDEDHVSRYQILIKTYGDRFRFVEKSGTQTSRGPGAARNRGIDLAQGDFIAFCDDDDRWIKRDHLESGCQSLDAVEADLFWADMKTQQGEAILNPSMYGEFPMLTRRPLPLRGAIFEVDRRSMSKFLRHRIIHCDSMVLRRTLLKTSGRYWDHLRFAEDHDFCFRLADASCKSLYRNEPVAALNVSPHPSVARSIDAVDRLLYGIMALNHAEAVVRDEGLLASARANRSWKLLELSEILISEKNKGAARRLVWESFFVKPSISGLTRGLRAL